MNRILFLLTLQFFATSLLAQQVTPSFKLYVFGSEYSGQTIAFQRDIEQNPALKARLTELNYQYLDGDHLDANIDAYRYRLLKGNRDYPFFVITDTQGDVYRVAEGYSTGEVFLETFKAEALASLDVIMRKDMITSQELQKIAQKQSNIPFTIRLMASSWRLGVEGGVVLSNLAGSEIFTSYKTGYYAGAYVKRNLPHRMAIQGLLSIYSLGGEHTTLNENLRLNYLTLPIDLEKVIATSTLTSCGSDISLSIGVYGSYLLSDKMPATLQQPISDWDAGARFRLVWQQGSFRFSAGYIRGFMDLFPGQAQAYTNAFQFGVTISLGD